MKDWLLWLASRALLTLGALLELVEGLTRLGAAMAVREGYALSRRTSRAWRERREEERAERLRGQV